MQAEEFFNNVAGGTGALYRAWGAAICWGMMIIIQRNESA